MRKKIKVNIFDDMKEALQDVAAYERGEPVNLRVTRIPARPKPISPKEVRHIRHSLKAPISRWLTFARLPKALRRNSSSPYRRTSTLTGDSTS